jgi:hypothetical protein
MKVLLDPNVPLNMYLHGFETRSMPAESIRVMDAIAKGRITGYVSPVGFHIVFYFLKRAFGKQEAVMKALDFLDQVQIAGQDEEVFRKALDSGWPDVEDAGQYFAAKHTVGITHLCTTNGRHYKRATGIKVVDPTQLLALL